MTDQPIIPSLGKLSRFATLLAAAAVLMSCSASAAATLPATPLTLPLVLLRAKGGDTVVLTGKFSEIAIKARSFSPALTLDLSQAKLARLVISGSKGIHVKGGEWTPAEVKEQVVVTSSEDVTFDRAKLTGNGKSYGFKFGDSAHVAVRNSHIEQAFQAINSGRVEDGVYSGNTIVSSNNDSIVIYASRGVKIQDNDIGGNERVDTRHPDGIQFIYRSKDGLTSSDVLVERNTITGPTQGIFGRGVTNGVFTANTITINHGNGLAIRDCVNCQARDNRVSTLPDSENQANINLGPDVVRCGNRVERGAGKPGMVERPCR